MSNKEVYSRIRVLGVAMMIPVSIAVGPIVGFFSGRYFIERFSLPAYTLFIFITLGFLASVLETVRIIKFMFKEEKR
jgi:hypothetical protein